MKTTGGYVAGDMKWHVYRYPQKPKTLMVIGSILTQPDDLESSLNYSSGIEPLGPGQVMDQTLAVRRTVRSELSKNAGGRLKAMVPINPLISAGGGVEAERIRQLEATVDALDVRAVAIMPDTAKEYINKALRTPKVVQYVKEGLWARPLYLIIGTATCRRLVVSDAQLRENKVSVEADVGIAGLGVEAGAGISKGHKASAGSEMEIHEECDFAYRVREFQYSRRRRGIKRTEDWVKGAMFSNDSAGTSSPQTSAEGELMSDEIPEFDGFEDEDEDIEEDNIE
ncbi:hypothetical protein O1611_g5794 [Lasiodiplodia mahajangana]|uniref:Uncharacterized protein n=1 Tax=Lasiodiplodia mahajangana TaxID=1108764 RepID=A0ACC2JKA1_9PEZI|nr:hypothetical protein O1611_g5794 [Lasiodiplodia mahajangana]